MMDLAPHLDHLHRITRTDPDPRVRHRADSLLLLANGMTQAGTARWAGCAPTSLRRWVLRYLADGQNGMADQAHSRRPPKLDRAARDLLETALTGSPLDDDYPVTMWTVADLTDLTDLLGQRGWTVHPMTVYRAPQALGYPQARSDASPGSRGSRLRQACAGRAAEKGALAGAGFRLVSVDECEVHTHPHLAKDWQRVGTRVTVAAAGQNQKRAVFGALDYTSGTIIHWSVPAKTGAQFAAFLDHVATAWPTDHVVLIMDNVSYHRASCVRDWGNSQDARITPFWYRPIRRTSI